uniref:(northern house mosquito) hypothetical protein n=1 Tax=Culex pipiens TaxID=7175 RepID=A0A8D8NLY4_CULPI
MVGFRVVGLLLEVGAAAAKLLQQRLFRQKIFYADRGRSSFAALRFVINRCGFLRGDKFLVGARNHRSRRLGRSCHSKYLIVILDHRWFHHTIRRRSRQLIRMC